MLKETASSLKKNDLLQWNDESGRTVTSRVLWLNRREDSVFVIDIHAGDAFPQAKKISHLVAMLTAGSMVKLAEDPWARFVDERQLGHKAREIRESAWKIISGLTSPHHEPDIYFRNRRGLMVKEAAEEHGVTVKTVYKYLRKYWQRGKNKNALLPDYDNSGGRGKFKRAGVKKRGRPRAKVGETGVGINIDDQVRKIIASAITGDAVDPEKDSARKVYERMLSTYYVNQISFRGADGRPVPLPGARVPTFAQFKYWSKLLTEDPNFGLPGLAPGGAGMENCSPETEIAAAFESAAEANSYDKLDSYVTQGFQAKIMGRLDLTADCFKAAIQLSPPLNLQVMLVLDLAAVLKEMGRYGEALEILAAFEKERGGELLPEVLKEVRANLKYLEILQEILIRTNTPPLPFSKIPTIIKMGVQRKLDQINHCQ